MFELVLTFVLPETKAAPPQFDQAIIAYATAAECQTARQWWNQRRQAQLPGMADDWRLLIGPSCRPRQPLTS